MPRVSGTDTKRPDHVLEIFTIRDVPVILAIESKETPHSVDAGIGPRLSAYMSNLVRSIPSIERDNTEGARWRQSEYSSDSDSFLYASGSAFLIANARDIASVAKRANADLQIGLRFSDHGRTCEVHLLPSTELGVGIIKLVERLPLSNAGLSVHVHQ